MPIVMIICIYVVNRPHSINQYNDIWAVLTIWPSSDSMPPKCSRKCSHGGGPPPSADLEMAVESMPVDPDPAFDFLAKIPSPVVFSFFPGSRHQSFWGHRIIYPGCRCFHTSLDSVSSAPHSYSCWGSAICLPWQGPIPCQCQSFTGRSDVSHSKYTTIHIRHDSNV